MWVEFGIKVAKLSYHQNNGLDLECRRIEENLQFTQNEISRIAEVSDLPMLKLSGQPRNSREFERLMQDLNSVQVRRSILQDRLVNGFESHTAELRNKIKGFINSVDATRLDSSQKPINDNSHSIHSSTSSASRDFFSNQSQHVSEIRSTLRQVTEYLHALGAKAEKAESKRDIAEAQVAVAALMAWLPQEDKYMSQDVEQSPAAVPSAPLTAARDTYEQLGRIITAVRAEVGKGWHLDEILVGATYRVDSEAAVCREAEFQRKQILMESFWKTGVWIIGGLAFAFLILVFADFLQSFFDTASNSATMSKMMEEGRWNR